jgi:hypothetical protein
MRDYARPIDRDTVLFRHGRGRRAEISTAGNRHLLLSDLLSEARCIGSRVCPMTVGHGPSALRAFAHSQAHDRHILIISRARAGRSEPTASGWGRPAPATGHCACELGSPMLMPRGGVQCDQCILIDEGWIVVRGLNVPESRDIDGPRTGTDKGFAPNRSECALNSGGHVRCPMSRRNAQRKSEGSLIDLARLASYSLFRPLGGIWCHLIVTGERKRGARSQGKANNQALRSGMGHQRRFPDVRDSSGLPSTPKRYSAYPAPRRHTDLPRRARPRSAMGQWLPSRVPQHHGRCASDS